MPTPRPMLRLLLWPSLVTLALTVARLVAEVNRLVGSHSGGAGVLLGITWCVFLFGGWFGFRLARAGAGPRVRRAWLFALLALLAIVLAGFLFFRPLLAADRSDATFALLRTAVLVLAGTALAGAAVLFAVWPALAWLLLLYALPARATVVAATMLAKHLGWDTHYTKFGPPGIEVDAAGTLVSASLAQFGFWVPFTVVGGVLAGSLVAGRQGRAGASSQAS